MLTEPDGTLHTLLQVAREKGGNNEAALRALLATLQELKPRGADTLLNLLDQANLIGLICDLVNLYKLFTGD
ncbi:hypothetical protein [Delftia tsuruhatensis]|uniref:hypothetical protein n=1 Tax=Delftia tsuruhatensis TaxID=180282 RepID=UPI0028A5FE7B|nr:hypothetical protein [Delftia tsuruhatensis]